MAKKQIKYSKSMLGGGAFILLLCLSLVALAMDSTLSPPTTILQPEVTSTSTSTTFCSFFYSDIFDGTMPPQSPAPTPNTTFTLKFNNNGAPSTASPEVPCEGTYKVVYTIQIQATTNVADISVVPTANTSTASVVYPQSGAPGTLHLYPQCNNSGYASTPYCTNGEISGSGVVTLTQGDKFYAPTLTTSAPVIITGGQFIAYLISPP